MIYDRAFVLWAGIALGIYSCVFSPFQALLWVCFLLFLAPYCCSQFSPSARISSCEDALLLPR